MELSAGILDGVRILDLTTGLAGSVATLLLAEAGADVVKIEPVGGDPIRTTNPAAFATWNRSKRSQVIDLTQPSGLGALEELLVGADVLVHGFTPSQARALGLDDDALAVRHPQLVCCAVTGYPGKHPDAESAASEILIQAKTGAMDEQKGHRDGPIPLRFPLASWPTAYLAATGVVVRLILQRRTGRGGAAHTSLYQGLNAVLAMLWNRAERPSDLLKMKIPLPKAMAFPAITLFECEDGTWIQMLGGFMENPLVIETIAMMGEEYVVVPFGQLPTPEQRAVWQKMFLSRPGEEWVRAFHDGDVPAELVRNIGEIFRDEQVRLNGYTADVDDPQWGSVRQALAPYRSEPPPVVKWPAPRPGEHDGESWQDRADEPAAADPLPSAPLAGLKVLDLGMFLAGPFAPMLLADLGATVIKLESTHGDRMRAHELLFIGCQRGKRSVALDLTKPESRPALEALVRWADVVHHNLRMPAARALGLDEESIRAINPQVVYCHVSSYGPEGPRADWPGYDPIAQAASGFMIEGAGAGNPPMWTRFGMMDHQCALSSLLPTVLALYRREQTGIGSSVTASLLGAAVMTNSETMLRLEDDTVVDVPHLDAHQKLIGEGQGLIEASDGWVAVDATTPEQLDALRVVLGKVDVPEGQPDPRGSAELLALLSDASVPCGEVRLDQEQALFDDPVLREVGLTVSYQHAVYGKLEQPGAFWGFGDLQLRLDRPPPALGEHTLEALTEVGVDADTIAAMAASGTISQFEQDRGLTA